MRTTELKIGTEKKEAVLMAGGQGFKIYSTSGSDDWVVVVGRKVHVIEEKSPAYKMVGRYVNLKYQRIAEQQAIKEHFQSLLNALKSPAADQPQQTRNSEEPESDLNTNSP